MKSYKKPEIKIIKFEIEDIIAASMGSADIDGGSAGFHDSWVNTDVDGESVGFLESWQK